MRKIISAIAIAALAPFAFASEALEFKGVPFGALMDEFKSRHPGFDCYERDQACVPSLREHAPQTFAGEPVEFVRAWFLEMRLARVMVGFKPRSFAAIVRALQDKYGSPARREESEYRTVGGAVAQNERLTWNFPDGASMTISKYGNSITGGYLVMQNLDGDVLEAREIEARRAKAKKDI